MSDCLFCSIAAGDIAADKVHEDGDVVAFSDINPQAPVHILVIPREHIGSLAEVRPSQHLILAAMLTATQSLAVAHGIAETGYRVVTNIGSDGGQTVQHLHLHLLGGRPMSWPPG